MKKYSIEQWILKVSDIQIKSKSDFVLQIHFIHILKLKLQPHKSESKQYMKTFYCKVDPCRKENIKEYKGIDKGWVTELYKGDITKYLISYNNARM